MDHKDTLAMCYLIGIAKLASHVFLNNYFVVDIQNHKTFYKSYRNAFYLYSCVYSARISQLSQ